MDLDFAGELFPEKEIVPYIPAFMQEEQGMSGADRGSAYHRVMELLDFEKVLEAKAQIQEQNQEWKQNQEQDQSQKEKHNEENNKEDLPLNKGKKSKKKKNKNGVSSEGYSVSICCLKYLFSTFGCRSCICCRSFCNGISFFFRFCSGFGFCLSGSLGCFFSSDNFGFCFVLFGFFF